MDIKNTNNIEISTDILYKNLLKECYNYGCESKHPTTHTAALLVDNNIVVLKGKNVLPPGVRELKERYEGENRHKYPNHAERDVIYKAAREGIKTKGLMMVMPWLPCIPCANAIISSGIEKIIVHRQMIYRTRDEWKPELEEALILLSEANDPKINIIAYDGIVGAKAYMHGEYWDA